MPRNETVHYVNPNILTKEDGTGTNLMPDPEPTPSKLPTVDYAQLTLPDIAKIGTEAADAIFDWTIGRGLASGVDLHGRMTIEGADNGLEEYATWTKHNGGQYAVNTGLDGGKLETVDKCGVDSDAALRDLGLELIADGDPKKPSGWPGGAHDTAWVDLDGVRYIIKFGTAHSGVQGWVDRLVSKTAAAAMAAAWVEAMKARHSWACRSMCCSAASPPSAPARTPRSPSGAPGNKPRGATRHEFILQRKIANLLRIGYFSW